MARRRADKTGQWMRSGSSLILALEEGFRGGGGGLHPGSSLVFRIQASLLSNMLRFVRRGPTPSCSACVLSPLLQKKRPRKQPPFALVLATLLNELEHLSIHSWKYTTHAYTHTHTEKSSGCAVHFFPLLLRGKRR